MREARRRRAGLPENIRQRGLSLEQAAEYCGCETTETYITWQRRGLVPPPIPGTRRYDRKAIDAALDQASGLTKDRARSSFEEWEAKHAG